MEKKNVFCESPTIYEPARNKIIELNEEFNLNCDFRYKNIIVYDFESLCLKNQINMSNTFKTNNEQRAVSVSLCSNIKGYEEEIFIENENPEIIFDEMFKSLDEMADVAIEEM